jgi:hypothetical protein
MADMSTELQRSTEKERKWSIWIGSNDELRRLADIVQEQAGVRASALLGNFDAETERQLEEALTREIDDLPVPASIAELVTDEMKSSVRQNIAYSINERRSTERDALERRLKVSATIVDGDDTTTGDIETVLAELDRRTVQSVEFAMTADRSDRLVVTLERKGKRHSSINGAKLKVTSQDRGWANQAFAQLSEELGKGQPGYAWVRTGRGRLAVLAGLAVMFIAISLVIAPAVPASWSAVQGVSTGYAFIIVALFVTAPNWFFEWLAPSFEITGEDRQSTGKRRIGAVTAPLIAIVIGIIVNRIYS